GGWTGGVIAAPLRALLATAGAAVVLVLLFVGGVLLVTSTSLRTMAAQTSRSVGSVARPLGRAAKKALSGLSTLSSEREAAGPGELPGGPDAGAHPGGPQVRGEPGAPRLYDGAEDDAAIFTAGAPAKPSKRRRADQAAAQ